MIHYLVFDLPTSTNKLYRRVGKKVTLSEEAKIYKEYAGLLARNQWSIDPLKGDIAITYRFYGTNADVDNLLKCLQDSLNGICFLDDKQIIELHAYVFRKDTNKHVEVSVQEL